MGQPTPSLDLLNRIAAAAARNEGLAPEDTAALAAAAEVAIAGNISLERALGLPPRWRQLCRMRARQRAASISINLGSIRSQARVLHQELLRYRSTRYEADAAGLSAPMGPRVQLFGLLLANNGHVPSMTTLRRLIAGSHGGASFGPRVKI